MTVEGIDVSHHQGLIDWPLLAESNPSIRFCFIKATQGNYYRDKNFVANAKGCKENDILPGPYHYLDARIDGAIQADYLYAAVQEAGGKSGFLQVVVDIEETFGMSRIDVLHCLDAFLARAKLWFGSAPIIYTYPYFWIRVLGNPVGYGDYPLWYAHYSTEIGKLPASWRVWTFWQYTSTGRVKGIQTIVDRNRFNGSYPNLLKFVMQ